MAYTKTTWVDNVTTANATNLNNIENGIKTIEDDIGTVSSLTTTSKEVVGAINELDSNKLENIVEDTTPQLGGNLDLNGKNVNNITPTEISYLDGVTSNIQTQLNNKIGFISGGTGKDINDYKTRGQYSFYGANTNNPIDEISTLEVIWYSGDWLLQRWTSIVSGKIWERRYHSGTTWSGWEIKNSKDGWDLIDDTLTYASSTTINTSTDLTDIIGIGDKIKLTQTTVKYFYVTAITSSLISVTGGVTYTIANATITTPYFSHKSSPIGFPKSFNYITELISDDTKAYLGSTNNNQFTLGDGGYVNINASFILKVPLTANVYYDFLNVPSVVRPSANTVFNWKSGGLVSGFGYYQSSSGNLRMKFSSSIASGQEIFVWGNYYINL